MSRVGKPLGEYTAEELEVHPAIELAGKIMAGDRLPQYVLRSHDTLLKEVVETAARGISQVAVLVGGSSTGKTRACWEAVKILPKSWRLWHPIDPTRPEAALAALADVGPNTVVWLNDAHHYLLTGDPRQGELVAAGLNTLLSDPSRAPALVLITIWPAENRELTKASQAGTPDPHPAARQLLTGSKVVTVPLAEDFVGADLDALRAAAVDDLRLGAALEGAESGRVIQYLAGVPDLERRYRTADSVPKAAIQAAMDARRFGHPLPMSQAFLEQAVPGYLDEATWSKAGRSWPHALTTALTDLGEPARGILGPLAPIYPSPGAPPAPNYPCYRLADYLDQTGRRERAGVFPPGSFWDAIASTVDEPAVLCQLAQAARARGRLRRAFQLFQAAADRGSTVALLAMTERREKMGDSAEAERLAASAATYGDTRPLRDLAEMRERAGERASAERLYQQAADNGDGTALWLLGRLRERGGDSDGAERLYQRAADGGNDMALWTLGQRREKAGDLEGAERLYRQGAKNGSATQIRAVVRLRELAGDYLGAEQVWRETADGGEAWALRELSSQRDQAGDREGAEQLAIKATDLGDMFALQSLAVRRYDEGDREEAERLAVLAADRGNNGAFVVIAERLLGNDPSGAERLYQMAADYGADVSDDLTKLRYEAGEMEAAEQIALMAADRGSLLALRVLALRRQDVGDLAGAERYFQMGVDRGHYTELADLAYLRAEAGDIQGAERLYQLDADFGDMYGLTLLADLWEYGGQPRRAKNLLLYGFTDGGEISEPWD